LDDFSLDDRKAIKDQLSTFIIHVRRLEEFKVCHDLASLAIKMVELKRHIVFPLVYRLIELAMLLPVVTALVERVFSAMEIIKTELRNKISDDWLIDLMVVYIEREIFKGIDLESIKKAFQKKKDRNMQLPKSPRRN
jgi:AMMECR1 domain-containing protein